MPEQGLLVLLKALPIIAAGIFLPKMIQDLPKEYINRLSNLFPALMALAAISFAVENLYNFPLTRILHGFDWGRSFGIATTNRGAVTLAVLLWPALGFLLIQGKRHYAAGLFILVMLSIFGTSASQSAMLGIAVGSIAFAGALVMPRVIPIITMAFIIAGVLCSPVIANKLYEVKPAALEQLKSAAAPQRMTIWHAVSIKIYIKPVTGWGVDATKTTAASVVQDKGPYKWKTIFHPHNAALQIWLETGVVGALFATAFLLVIFLGLYRFAPIVFATDFAAYVSIIAISIVGYSLWQGWWIGLLALAVTMITMTVRRADTSNDP